MDPDVTRSKSASRTMSCLGVCRLDEDEAAPVLEEEE